MCLGPRRTRPFAETEAAAQEAASSDRCPLSMTILRQYGHTEPNPGSVFALGARSASCLEQAERQLPRVRGSNLSGEGHP